MEVRAGGGGQELRLLPTTAWGKWAVGFAAAFVPLLVLFVVLLSTGPQGGTRLTFTPRLIPGLLAAGCMAAALTSGLIGLVFRGERSVLAALATGIGAMVTLFLVGEFAIPPYD